MSTVFKWKRKYVKGERLFWGYVYIKGHGIINSFDGIIEKKAIKEFRYRIRVKQTEHCFNMKTCKFGKIHKNQILIVNYTITDTYQQTFLISENGFCINPKIHDIEPISLSKPIMVQIIESSGAIVRETINDTSRAWGVIKYGTIVLIEDINLTLNSSSFNHVRLKLYHQPGYIHQYSVRLLGYADNATIQYYAGGEIETFIQSMITPRNCIICQEKSSNSTFVHGENGHSVCCLECGIKVLEKDARCPICRMYIEKIILNIFS